MKKHIESLMNKIELPSEAITYLLGEFDHLGKNDVLFNKFTSLNDKFYANETADFNLILADADKIGDKLGINKYTIEYMLILYMALQLHENYKKSSLPDGLFYSTMMDMNYKLHECRKMYGVWGTMSASWTPLFYRMRRFALGRLQYNYDTFDADEYTKAGYTLRNGDLVFSMHIPSSGPLTRQSRLDSYKMAYKFFYNEFEGSIMPIACGSWLLYPANNEFFPKNSNILDFQNDFDIILAQDSEKFSDLWRVFYKDTDTPYDELPCDTSLQRAYVKWLKSGGKTGTGYGIMLFDGEKIL